MYGLRDIPPLEAKVQETVAWALAGRVFPDVLADAVAVTDAVLDALAVAVA